MPGAGPVGKNGLPAPPWLVVAPRPGCGYPPGSIPKEPTIMLIQVKASAGSGKTHALTGRFIDLVLGASRDLPRACGDTGDGAYAVPDILAVTFTN